LVVTSTGTQVEAPCHSSAGGVAAPSASPAARLWRNQHVTTFWAGQTLSVLGDAVGGIALPLLVLQATGSLVQMGLVTAASGAGSLLAGLFAGAVVDRVDRRRLMIVSDVLRMLLFAAIPIGWRLAGPQLWLIYTVVTLGAVLGMLFQVACITAVANLVARDQITDANSRLQTTFALASVLGPMLAGLIAQRFSPADALGVGALSFAASSLSLSFVRLRRAAASHPAMRIQRGRSRWHDELLAGVRYLLANPVLRAMTILLMLFSLSVAGRGDLYIFHLKHDLGQNNGAIGFVFGMAALGAIASATSQRHLPASGGRLPHRQRAAARPAGRARRLPRSRAGCYTSQHLETSRAARRTPPDD
jgi:MFS family permease